MRSNGLLKWLMSPVALLVLFVGIRLFSGGGNDAAPRTQTASALTPDEMKALGIEGDTPNDTVATLVALDDAKPVEFAEGDATRKVSPGQWLQDLIANAKPAVDFGEFAGGNVGTQVQAGAAHGKSDAEVDKAAQAYAAQHKVDYSEALRAVTATFTSAA